MGNFLTLEQLLQFCKDNKLTHFSSAAAGKPIGVTIPATYAVEDDPARRGMLTLRVKVCHTGVNRNHTCIREDTMRKAMPSLKNRPLLACIHQLDDGSYDFESHNMAKDQDGNDVYLEQQIGSFTEDEPFIEHDDAMDKDYVIAYAVVSEEYTRAADIIREKGGSKNSCELVVDNFTYDVEAGCLEINDFYFCGSTLLGRMDDGTEIGEGMLGSRADIVEFGLSGTNQSSDIENFEEGGNRMEEEKLINTQDETEAAPSAYDDGADPTNPETPGEGGGGAEPTNPVTPGEGNGGAEGEGEGEDEPLDTSTDLTPKKRAENAFEKYELSLNEKEDALFNLVNATYSEADNTIYMITAYDTYVVMRDWFSPINYKQSYTETDGVFALTGERVRVYATYLTKEELAEIDNMRKENAELKDFKASAEKVSVERGEKLALLNSEKFAALHDEDKYTELIKNIDSYSLTDLEKEAKVVLFDYREAHPVENHKIDLELETKPVKKTFGTLFN